MGEDALNQNYGVLEQNLSQQIKALYLNQLGHQPDKVECQLIDKTLTIMVENSITQPERLLLTSGKQEVAELVHHSIHKAFEPQLKALIEEIIGVCVLEITGDPKLQTGCTSIVAILAATPYLPIVKQQTLFDSDGGK